MNWSERPHRGRMIGLLAGLSGGPVAVVALYLATASWIVPPEWWGLGLVAAALLGVIIGLMCVARLPEPVAVRVVLAVLYVPAVVSGLMLLWATAEKLSPETEGGQLPRSRPSHIERG